MEDKFAKYLSWGFYAIMGIGSLLGIVFFASGSFDTMMQFSYVLIILTAIVSFIAPVYNFIQHPKNTKNFLLVLALVGVIALISYLFAGNSYSALELETLKMSASESVWISFGIVFTTIVIILTAITVLFASLYKLFK
ncbi:MAG: hypothetical protein KKD74_01150 [Bacteroidetes bacterium]|nr:hypothetical protein [Bacteroidales bacterium]MBU1008715.1 hypothetical protein [Bacteroidota bacterium]